MKKKNLFWGLLLLVTQTGNLNAQDLIHYWNFNETNFTVPTISLVGSATITASATPPSEFLTGTGNDFGTINERLGEGAGTHLRYNTPIGETLTFEIATTGYQDVVAKFVTRRSGSGSREQVWKYSIDGVNFINFETIAQVTEVPTLYTLDFSAIAEANDNPNFKVQVQFEQGVDGGLAGNNRIDNFTVDANQLGGVDTNPPTATFTPIDGATNVAVESTISIAFNEAIRLVDDSVITTANIENFITLLETSSNTSIDFTAIITGNTLELTPDAPLANNEMYSITIAANTIEDENDNAITTDVVSSFTTIPVQTAFQAGDLAIVGYRMNATDTEDEIAIVSFVDILPGTFLTITDSKFTNNAQEQCANGLVWTVGANDCITAGTVIRIQTDAVTTSHGTIAGSGFGLSSGGDQIIIYAGSADAPNYVTALSSNGWVTSNTSCSGSLSMLPSGLVDGTSSMNTSTAPGNVSGNAVNAFYSGDDNLSIAALKTLVFDPANWTAVGGSTAAQTWPNWNFPTSITVVSALVENAQTITLTFNQNVDPTTGADVNNYTGISGLTSATVAGNEVTLSYSTTFSGTLSLQVNDVQDLDGNVMNCSFTHEFTYETSIALAEEFIVVNEDHGTLTFTLNLENPSISSVDLVVKGAPFSTADANDFTLTTQTLEFNGTSALTQTINIPIIDDTAEEQQAEYFVLSLENPVGLTIDGETFATIYIKDNDRLAKVPSTEIELDYVGSFDPSGNNSSTCEVVTYDATTKRLFVTSSIGGVVDIIDFEDPTAPALISTITMAPYGGVTSVGVRNGIVAVASPALDESQDGKVIFFDIDGEYISEVTVGNLPDNLVFTPDGTKVMTANEGQPPLSYAFDPEGSVSIIDVSQGVESITQAQVTTLLFTDYNAQEATLIASGVRKLQASSTLSQDLEPEYISIAADNSKAWVTLQENNAIAEIDLTNNSITDIWALGTKDMSVVGNGMDASDNNGEVLIANWPVESYLIPDAVATYQVNGVNYIITANEGDEKEYTGLVERVAVSSNDYELDETSFPHAEMLKKNHNLGRFRATNLNGNTGEGGSFEKIHSVGSRSFSIFNADTKELVFDSGDDFEMYTAAHFPTIFNSDHEENSPKGRSRSKGPEPEGVTIATIDNKVYAFVALERVGGVFVYDVTNPTAPIFVDYKNNRSTSSYGGDNGAETLIFIPKEETTTDKNYLVIANEISGTLTIYEVNGETENVGLTAVTATKPFNIFPNPTNQSTVYFNRTASVKVFNTLGTKIFEGVNIQSLDVSNYKAGMYLITTTEGKTQKLIIK